METEIECGKRSIRIKIKQDDSDAKQDKMQLVGSSVFTQRNRKIQFRY